MSTSNFLNVVLTVPGTLYDTAQVLHLCSDHSSDSASGRKFVTFKDLGL